MFNMISRLAFSFDYAKCPVNVRLIHQGPLVQAVVLAHIFFIQENIDIDYLAIEINLKY